MAEYIVPSSEGKVNHVKLGEHIAPFTRAVMCAGMGWRVFPVRPESKTPAIKSWQRLASRDRVQLSEWWEYSHVGCEVGILTGPESGIWVLDIDVKWTNGLISVRDLFTRHGVTELPDTFRVSTPSGGQQWYFAHPPLDDGQRIRNITSEPARPGALGPGLDVRGWHGQVLAPGTLTRRVLHDVAPSRAPEWLEKLVIRSAEDVKTPQQRYGVGVPADVARRALDKVAHQLAQVGNGGRNAALNRAAFALGGLACVSPLAREEASEALWKACDANGLLQDDNGEAQFQATFKSGWDAGIQSGENK